MLILIIPLFLLICLFSMSVAAISLAPWVPCRSRDLERIFRLANLKEKDCFYDLGCGTGRLVFYAAKNFKANAIGIELAMPMYFICKIKSFFLKNKNVSFKWKNLYDEKLQNADVIYVWGMPKTLKGKFLEKIMKETKKGTKLISYTFAVEGLKPIFIDKPNSKEIPIYLYEI